MADAPTWNNPIKGYFTPIDVDHMKQRGLDLSSYTDVVANAEDIFNQVATGNMPPGDPWPQDWINNFGTWAENGFPES